MIPLLIVWLLKNLRKVKTVAQTAFIRTTAQLVFVLALFTGFVHAQEKIFRYNILHNGEIKGMLTGHQRVNGG